ncbi:MAG: hypothetical protein D3926_11930 [Desulfobacteraceae bacterium]|nr:MAG: hypothetical protein D3926_11930 [Desulfobacteraceae bacterium]
MQRTLGILVTSEKYIDYVMKLSEAAGEKGVATQIFFTGSSVSVMADSRFQQLCRRSTIHICEANYRSSEGLVMSFNDHGSEGHSLTSHAKNAQMVKECDRYLVF